jgi:hypothetical protein
LTRLRCQHSAAQRFAILQDMQLQFSGLVTVEAHLTTIRNLYWHVRALRICQSAKRRKLYRAIAKEKAVLIAHGFDSEQLRLWCRMHSRCHPEAAALRYEAYLQKK